MTITTIETHYAGCRFRSRLEARWAVFFDNLNIRWEYEPEGFECSARLTLGRKPIPYLPDFWLPDFNMWGEAKGHLNDEALTRLLDVAASLSGNNGGGCHDSGGNDLVVFGNIPRPTENGGRVPTRLHMHKGDLQWSPWLTDGDGAFCSPYGERIAADVGGDIYEEARRGLTPETITQTLLHGTWVDSVPVEMRDALQAARSARFEHGEALHRPGRHTGEPPVTTPVSTEPRLPRPPQMPRKDPQDRRRWAITPTPEPGYPSTRTGPLRAAIDRR